jgi:hypothetical protein
MSLPTSFFIGRGAIDPLKGFPGESGRLFATTQYASYELSVDNFTTASALQGNDRGSYGNFPAAMMDTIYDSSGNGWIVVARNNSLWAARIDVLGSWVESSIGYGTRAFGTSRNGYLIVSNDSSPEVRSYTIDTSGNLSGVGYYSDSSVTNCQSIISPPNFASSTLTDKSNLSDYTGSSCHVVTAGSNYIKRILVGANGALSASAELYQGAQSQLAYYPNGYVLVVPDNQAVRLLNENLVQIATGSQLNSAGSVTMGGDGRVYVGASNYQLYQFYPVGNASYLNVQFNFSGDTAKAPDYSTRVMAMGDYVYYSGYIGNSWWNYVKRHPLGTPLASANLEQSPNHSSYYTEHLTSGRPHWANQDESFILGSGW